MASSNTLSTQTRKTANADFSSASEATSVVPQESNQTPNSQMNGHEASKSKPNDSNLLCYLCHLPARLMASRDPSTARAQSAVRELYSKVATDPHSRFHFNRGSEYAVTALAYDRTELESLPSSSTDCFAGVGNPHIIDSIKEDEVVLDIGSGSGTDLLLAARKVGSRGRAVGIDFTREMIARCRASVEESQMRGIEVLPGEAENLPFGDTSIDVVISNGVFNLVPDKERAFHEIYRVLRPGGRLMFGDTVVSSRLVSLFGNSAALWALCVAGALPESKLVGLISKVGFHEIRITHRFDCVRGTSGELFARFLGLKGVNVFALKPSL